MTGPASIRHYSELASNQDSYPGDEEILSTGTPLSRPLGLTRLGIHHELLPPGHRTSWPHAEELEEEFAYVLEGTPSVWIDGELYLLGPGDCVAFVPGTGSAHTFINDSELAARLLVVGERLPDNRVYYPLHPQGYSGMPERRRYTPSSPPALGPHPGTPRREGR